MAYAETKRQLSQTSMWKCWEEMTIISAWCYRGVEIRFKDQNQYLTTLNVQYGNVFDSFHCCHENHCRIPWWRTCPKQPDGGVSYLEKLWNALGQIASTRNSCVQLLKNPCVESDETIRIGSKIPFWEYRCLIFWHLSPNVIFQTWVLLFQRL